MTYLRLFVLLAIHVAVCSCTPAAALDMRGDTIYMMLPDRFFDGDPSNNTAVDPNLYSAGKTDWQKFWGGDLAGIKQKLDYLEGVGVTSIWVTPIYQNAPVIGTYHGYQMQDLFRVDPHHGTWATVDSLTCDMHSRAMKLMLDISLNSGPATGAGVPAGSQCVLKKDGVVVARYHQDTANWFHHFGPLDFNNASYWDQVHKDIFGLADLNQDTPAVMDYLKQGAAIWQYHGVDSFRLDAAKHFEPSHGREWMDSSNQVAGWLGKDGTHAIGEWYGGGAWNDESLWWSSTAGTAQFDFQLHEQIRGVTGEWRSMFELRDTLYYRHAKFGLDGGGEQNVHRQGIFFDSHDNQRLIIPLLQKYGYGNIGDVRERIAMALGLLEMLPGIPVVFYGTEQYLYNDTPNQHGLAGGDPYNRPMMTTFDTNTLAARVLKRASDLRRVHPAVQRGNIVERWIDANVFVFSREASGSAVLVGVNNSWQSRTVSVPSIPFPNGSYSDVVGITNDISVSGGSAQVTIPARSTVIFSHLPSPIPVLPIPDRRCGTGAPATGGPPSSGAITIDGASISADFAGRLRATQNNPTMFGDATASTPGSELDQLFVTNDGANLFVGLTGNLEQNQNCLLLLLETGTPGENTISATAGPGVVAGISGTRMDEGFAPRWLLVLNAVGSGSYYVDLVDLVNNTSRFVGSGTVNSGNGALSGGTNPGGIQVAFNNTNQAGVTAASISAANSATTGFEIKLPFSDIELLSNQVRLMSVITGSSGYFSNQSLPPMGLTSASGSGGYANLGTGPIDFGKVAGTQFSTVTLTGITYQSYTSLAELRQQPDGMPVSITGMVGIGAFSYISSFYLQDPVHHVGLRVIKSALPYVAMGQIGDVKGFLSTQDGERVLLATEVQFGNPAEIPEAVGMNNRTLGGEGQHGAVPIEGSVGLTNTGLHVSSWGKVTAVGADSGGNTFFYLDDGSALLDGAVVGGNPAGGVRVYTSFALPGVGTYVRVKGVAGVEFIDGKSQRRLLTRQPSDVQVL